MAQLTNVENTSPEIPTIQSITAQSQDDPDLRSSASTAFACAFTNRTLPT